MARYSNRIIIWLVSLYLSQGHHYSMLTRIPSSTEATRDDQFWPVHSMWCIIFIGTVSWPWPLCPIHIKVKPWNFSIGHVFLVFQDTYFLFGLHESSWQVNSTVTIMWPCPWSLTLWLNYCLHRGLQFFTHWNKCKYQWDKRQITLIIAIFSERNECLHLWK